ncbi:MAG: T9SS type A sorting domain-containing protein [Bacteroidetes bacterium]|nr:T9SS type A sorting domain-containing protein [Bacteroidota bacterium]
MKKFYITIVAIMLCPLIFGQTFIFEDFSSGTMPPPGWTSLPIGSQWSSSNTDHAGGVAPEAKYSNGSGTGTARLMSPVVDLTGIDTVILVFKHYHQGMVGGPKIGVATRGGSQWLNVWEVTPNGNLGPEEKQLVLTGGDVGKPNFQLSFYVTGNLANITAWYIDDVIMKSPSGLDCKMTSILVPSTITGPVPVSGVITNLGNTVINEVNISWQSYTGSIFDSTFSGLAVNLLESYQFDFDGMWISAFGYHPLKVWINTVNGIQDQDPANDTLTKTVAYYANILPRIPTLEEFTSSTCGPCATFNTSFVPWCQQHEDEIVLVKYQMNWPGSGDPYFTAEGGTRRNYYGVTYVPDLFGNGSRVSTNVSSVQTFFNNASPLTSYLDIASSFTITGTIINVTTNILPWADYGTKRVHNVVFEKKTTGNVGSNGETEFHHVMMKMLPDANGANVTLNEGEAVSLTYTYDMAQTHVEQMGDLMIAVIIQDQSSREILQAEYGLMDANYSDEARLDAIFLDGEPLEGFDPDVFEYNVALPEGTVEEPMVTVETMNDGALPVINRAFIVPGTSTIEVYAENRLNTELYTINYTIATSIGETPRPFVHIYPNPVRDIVHISGISNAQVNVFSTDGKLMISKENFNDNILDLSGLPKGIYILNVVTNDNYVIRKKVVVL